MLSYGTFQGVLVLAKNCETFQKSRLKIAQIRIFVQENGVKLGCRSGEVSSREVKNGQKMAFFARECNFFLTKMKKQNVRKNKEKVTKCYSVNEWRSKGKSVEKEWKCEKIVIHSQKV